MQKNSSLKVSKLSKLCECGCDNYANSGKTFITGHNCRRDLLTPENLARVKKMGKVKNKVDAFIAKCPQIGGVK